MFDLVERIPAAMRAGLVALALIAIALWALWVRGRRRLQHNAYLDPVTDGVPVRHVVQEPKVLPKRAWRLRTSYT